MSIQDKSFQHWTINDIILLGLKEKGNCNLLNNWLNASYKLSEMEEQIVNRLLKKASKSIKNWNEQELQYKFIGHVVELVDFDNIDLFFSSFSERRLETTYRGVKLKGKVDWVVAMGQSAPILPFFFIHEYKKEKGYAGDPEAQLLSSMLAAQTLNQTPITPTLFDPLPNRNNDMPIYGCYIIGKWWYFVVLDGEEYCISKQYNSVEKTELLKIIAILKKQKQMIIDRIKTAKQTK